MTTYQRPSWPIKNIANRAISWLIRLRPQALQDKYLLAVRGRQSGQWRTVPVNVVSVDGARYLVAPRGETEWVRNIRKRGDGELRRGSQTDPIQVTELSDAEKLPILRAYLQRWHKEVGKYFEVSDPDASDDDLQRIAPNHPAFRITERG